MKIYKFNGKSLYFKFRIVNVNEFGSTYANERK